MKEDLFENTTGISSEEALTVIESFFKKELPQFELTEKVANHSAYFTVTFRKDDIEIILSSGRLRFEHSFKINGKEYPLRQFDSRMDNVLVTSEKNIRFTLDAIKRFLS
ncbi:hypothetical protein [Pontibacter virosus]|uniref:Uncharacterized protein n=1 Tax=Pontibacter virosus TaxID=1765052 RepID=A0A2U1ATI7_9BACT|nr:hypothetical protein [Pontibacter virosus]PVY39712.1 hypothetical protein C8E01_110101 [Pontibacter virosus]